MADDKPAYPRVFEAVSRRGYWIGIGSIVLVLIGLSIWGGLYSVKVHEENLNAQVQTNDPLTEILYSPLGNAVVLLVLQYVLANLIFWPAAWVGLRLKK
ncbi:MAG: hypothetical protein AAF911_12690 [Planctomycetota bacterium]